MIMWQYCLMLLLSLFDLFTTVLSTAYGYIYIYLIFLQEAAKKVVNGDLQCFLAINCVRMLYYGLSKNKNSDNL